MSPVPDVLPKIEPNLLFGAIALLRERINSEQFARAAAALVANFNRTLGDILVSENILTKADQIEVQRDVARIIARHGGEPDPNIEFERDRMDPLISELEPSNLTQTFSLVRSIGVGGVGEVFAARDKVVHRLVALKKIRPELCGRQYQRLLIKEAQVAAQLEHPNILPVYEFGLDPVAGQPYYVMRLVEGKTLKEAIQIHHQQRKHDEEAVRFAEFLRLINAFLCVCNAIAYAHSRGVIHRDLKPSNVLLGEFGQVFVFDWGFAKLVDPSSSENLETQSTHLYKPVELSQGLQNLAFDQFAGSPAYMAPEQFTGQNNLLNEKTDIYGLGCILYEILTGCPPSKSSKQDDNASEHQPDAHAQTQSTQRNLTCSLDAICAKAMSNQQSDRHSSVKEFSEEILRWLACPSARIHFDQNFFMNSHRLSLAESQPDAPSSSGESNS